MRCGARECTVRDKYIKASSASVSQKWQKWQSLGEEKRGSAAGDAGAQGGTGKYFIVLYLFEIEMTILLGCS